MRPTVRKVARFLAFHPDVFINDPAYQLRTLRHAPEMSNVICEVKEALQKGCSPIKCNEGTSFVFYLPDLDHKIVAIFKLDHFVNEYAAYRLDHHRFAGVPPTALTTLSHPLFGGAATGSIQLFIHDAVAAVELSDREYASFTAAPIRRMAQLDIRMVNPDRHTSNILVRNKKEVVPIDHGYALTGDLGRVNYVWTEWEQAGTPFSSEEKAYIAQLDPEKDRAMLIEEMGMGRKAADRLYISTLLLKLGARFGFYPNRLGVLQTQNREDSPFEKMMKRLEEYQGKNWATFTLYVHEEIERLLGRDETSQ